MGQSFNQDILTPRTEKMEGLKFSPRAAKPIKVNNQVSPRSGASKVSPKSTLPAKISSTHQSPKKPFIPPRNLSPEGSSINSENDKKLDQKSEIQKKRVSIMDNRNSPSMFRTLNQSSNNKLSVTSNSKLAQMATQASGFNMLPRDTMHLNTSNNKLQVSNSSRRSFKFMVAAPTKYLNNKSSRIFQNEEQANDTLEMAVFKMKNKRILQMKAQIQQMHQINKFKKE